MTDQNAPSADDDSDAQCHGGDLDRARERFGGAADQWLDLSTGVNAAPYPTPPIAPASFARLPGQAATNAAESAARLAYGVPKGASVLATAGAQAAIDAVPRLRSPGRAAVLGPTYSEHAAAFRRAGWRVDEVSEPEEASEADALVIVNPNNPTGRTFESQELLRLLRTTRLLILDESFADVAPDCSCVREAGRSGLIILRSFGKFYGLAGVRLGFAITDPDLGARLREHSGPWPVSGPALEIGAAALQDETWRAATLERLAADAARLDALAQHAGWGLVGGCGLFRTYDCGDASNVQNTLARHRVWTRKFDYAPRWIRFGLPGDAAGWRHVERAMTGFTR